MIQLQKLVEQQLAWLAWDTSISFNTHSNVRLGGVGNKQNRLFGHSTTATITETPSFSTLNFTLHFHHFLLLNHTYCPLLPPSNFPPLRHYEKTKGGERTRWGSRRKKRQRPLWHALSRPAALFLSNPAKLLKRHPFLSAYKSPPYSLHQIKHIEHTHTHTYCARHTHSMHTTYSHLSRLQKSWQIPSDRQAGRSERGEWWRGRQREERWRGEG